MLKRFEFNFRLSVASGIFTSAVLLLIPVTQEVTVNFSKAVTAVLGICFWLGVAGIILFAVRTNSRRKKIEKKLKRSGTGIYSERQIGCISFFKNKEAVVCDIVLFASAITFAVLLWLKNSSQLLQFSLLSVIFLSFNLHCHLNGKNYVYIKLLKQYYKNKKGNVNND